MAFSTHDAVSTSPTNVFATLNPLLGTSNGTFNDGNLKITTTADGEMYGYSSIAIPHTGMWYIEFALSPTGIIGISKDLLYNTVGGSTSYGLNEEGRIYENGSDSSGANTGRSWTSGDIINLVIDPSASSNNLSWYKNGTSSSNLIHQHTYDLTNASFFVLTGKYSSNTYINFGQDHTFGGYPNSLASSSGYSDANGIGSFYYQPPTGALALCTSNIQNDLAIDPNVDDVPEDFFKCVTWTGDHGGTRAIPHNMPTAPDLVWIKNTSDSGYGHTIFDSVRGYGANELQSSSAAVQGAYSGTYGYVNSVDNTNINTTDGTSAGYADRKYTNYSGDNYVSWYWKAGGSPSGSNIYMKDDTGYTNSTSDKATVFGSASNYNITPTKASIGTKQGTGIYTFTASTSNTKLPHGLGKAPEFVIIKSTNTASTNWVATFPALAHDFYLNTNGARINGSSAGAYFQTTADADAITFGLQSTTYSNKPSLEYVVYAFTSIEGFSAFGSYTSVGATSDSNFVYLGFKPALVILKATGGVSGFESFISWVIYDNARKTANPNHSPLFANLAVSEGYRGNGTTSTGGNTLYVDFLSNGFKIRSEAAEYSGSNSNPITYACWAEMPFKYSNAK